MGARKRGGVVGFIGGWLAGRFATRLRAAAATIPKMRRPANVETALPSRSIGTKRRIGLTISASAARRRGRRSRNFLTRLRRLQALDRSPPRGSSSLGRRERADGDVVSVRIPE